ncbi:MAG TPA: hypothetical protein PKE06_19575 [Flavilitoribacter sp.]|mgnify:CR=1 FL=1|nr:hypothetical protein [Flavilitoribacter sp.]HMQ90833.1 hypothetical protein [Flavilitoribacter sp.]
MKDLILHTTKTLIILILIYAGQTDNPLPDSSNLDTFLSFSRIDPVYPQLPGLASDLPSDLAAARDYIDQTDSPFQPLSGITEFLFDISKKNLTGRIRNGNVPESIRQLESLKSELHTFRQYTEALDVPPNISKKNFKSPVSSGDNTLKSRLWNPFKKQKRVVEKDFRNFRFQLELTYSTELAIWQQQIHLPELHHAIGLFQNLDGSALPVYVITFPRINIDPVNRIVGMAMFVQYNGLFTSVSPALERKYPQLPGREKALTVYLAMQADGKVLSHEFGHLYYLYHHWNDYTAYILARGSGYEYGSHEEGDPCGKAALLAESGVMPD